MLYHSFSSQKLLRNYWRKLEVLLNFQLIAKNGEIADFLFRLFQFSSKNYGFERLFVKPGFPSNISQSHFRHLGTPRRRMLAGLLNFRFGILRFLRNKKPCFRKFIEVLGFPADVRLSPVAEAPMLENSWEFAEYLFENTDF